MITRSYYLTLHVPAEKLALVIEILAGECDIVKTEPSSNKTAREHKIKRRRIAGTRTGQILLDYFRQLPEGISASAADVGTEFESKGYKASSATPLLSSLTERGILERVAMGKYRLSQKGRGNG